MNLDPDAVKIIGALLWRAGAMTDEQLGSYLKEVGDVSGWANGQPVTVVLTRLLLDPKGD